MTASPFYPPDTCTVAEMKNHPAFMLLMKKQAAGKLEKPQVFYELSRIAQDPDRFGDGIGLFDFLDECTSIDASDGTIEELIRMNVYRMVKDEHGSRLVPCAQIEAAREHREGKKAVGYYMQIRIADAAKVHAAQNHMSASRLAEIAIAAYLGIPPDTPV